MFGKKQRNEEYFLKMLRGLSAWEMVEFMKAMTKFSMDMAEFASIHNISLPSNKDSSKEKDRKEIA